MPGDIARVVKRSLATVCRVLSDAPYWTLERIAARDFERLHRSHSTLASRGWPNFQKANTQRAAKGYRSLAQGRITMANNGWPNLKQGRITSASLGWPNTKKAAAAAVAAGNPGANIQARKTRGIPLARTHQTVRKSERTKFRIYVTLADWDDAHDGKRTLRAIERAMGRSHGQSVHLRRLRADGLIDAENRVIAPWPESDETSEPTATVELTEQMEGE